MHNGVDAQLEPDGACGAPGAGGSVSTLQGEPDGERHDATEERADQGRRELRQLHAR